MLDNNEKNSLHTTESAAVASKMSGLVETFSALTIRRVSLAPSMKPAAVKKALAWCETHPNGGDGAKKVKTSIRMKGSDPVTGAETLAEITVADLFSLWDNGAYSLAKEWPTPRAFLSTALIAAENYAVEVSKNRAKKAAVVDAATERLYEGETERQTTWINLGESLLPPGVSQPDHDFLYSQLRLNSGAFYWIIPGCTPLLIPRKEQTGFISNDPAFWAQWTSFAYELIKFYRESVIASAQFVYDDCPTEAGLPEESLDQRLLRFIPRVILENLKLGFRRKKEGENGWAFDGFSVELNSKGRGSGMAMSAWQDRMSEKMLACIEYPSVKQIKQFSNSEGDGLTFFSLAGIDLSGRDGRERGKAGVGAPELPQMWKRFLFGKDGNTPIFEGDPEMSSLRLAYFVTQLVQERGYTRQILFIAGSGNDGKTVLMESLKEILGGQCSCTINAQKLGEDSVQYGILNKTLICAPEVKDPKAFLLDEFVKKITGRDTMTLRKLYAMPIEYKPEHCFLMATTNNTVYANGRAAYSRLLPLTFRINYTVADMLSPEVLKAGLVGESDPFVQWCFDTLAYYQSRKNAAGKTIDFIMANGLRLITDERYSRWLDGEPLDDPAASMQDQQKELLAQQKEAINNSGNSRFLALDYEDSEEDDGVIFGKLFDKILEKDPSGFLATADLMTALLQNRDCVELKLSGIQPEKRQYCSRWRAFMAYLRGLDGVTETRSKVGGVVTRGLSGLKVKDDPFKVDFTNPL